MASTDHFLQAALDADAQKQILEAELRESLKRADELGRDAAHFDAQIRATDLTAAAAKAGLTKQFRGAWACGTCVAEVANRCCETSRLSGPPPRVQMRRRSSPSCRSGHCS